jgi:hypothetical protein
MILIVPHRKTKQETIATIDRNARDMFLGVAGSSVEIANFNKQWTGPTMAFSFVGKLGFIEVPMSGTLDVDDTNVTVKCDLPPMVANFIGESKISSAIEGQLKKLL